MVAATTPTTFRGDVMSNESAQNILNVVADLVTTLAPELAAPTKVVKVLIEDALGAAHELAEDGVKASENRETEAGRSISRASHLAGLREAITRIVADEDIEFAHVAERIVDAIMAEIAKRMP